MLGVQFWSCLRTPGDGEACQKTFDVEGCDEDCCEDEGPAELLRLSESNSSDMVSLCVGELMVSSRVEIEIKVGRGYVVMAGCEGVVRVSGVEQRLSSEWCKVQVKNKGDI